MIIIIINSILFPLASPLLLHISPTLRPFLLFCSSNSPFPLGSCRERERERERERDREIKQEEAMWEADSSLEEESAAVEHFLSAEIGGPSSLESDIEEIG